MPCLWPAICCAGEEFSWARRRRACPRPSLARGSRNVSPLPGVLILFLLRRAALRGSEGQASRITQNLLLLRRESTESSRLNFAFPRPRRHSPERFNGAANSVPALHRQTVELLPHPAKVLFLRRRQVFPGLHSAQDLLLPLRGKAVESLQALLIFLLSFTRQTPESRIVLQSAALLLRRQIAVTAQPLSKMMPLLRRLIRAELPLLGGRSSPRLRSVSTFRSRYIVPGLRTRFLASFAPRRRTILSATTILRERGCSDEDQHHTDAGAPSSNLCSQLHCVPGAVLQAALCSRSSRGSRGAVTQGFAFTSCWTCISSSRLAAESGSESENKSWFLSSSCKSPTAVPG
jgi:hypothetical protein